MNQIYIIWLKSSLNVLVCVCVSEWKRIFSNLINWTTMCFVSNLDSNWIVLEIYTEGTLFISYIHKGMMFGLAS